MIYKKLLKGNERFGTKPRDLCNNLFSCEPELINKNVVVAPIWKPEIYSNFGAKIDVIFNGYQIQIYNIHIGKIDFTYINTGIGAPMVGDTTLTLGCTPCEKAIFNVIDNSINNKTLFNGRLDEEREYIHKVRNEIIPQIIINILK